MSSDVPHAAALPSVAMFTLVLAKEGAFLFASINDAARSLLASNSISVLGEKLDRVLSPDLAELIRTNAAECLERRQPVAFTSSGLGGPTIAYFMAPAVGSSTLLSVTALPAMAVARLPLLLEEQQRFATLGHLARGVAHDINNVMAAAELALSSALRTVADGSVTHQRLTLVEDAINLSTLLLRKVLAFSAGAEGRASSVDLPQTVSDAVNLVRPLLPRNVQLRLEFGASTRPVRGNRSELMQVVLNLALNAMHATEANSGTVALTVSEKHIGSPLRVGRQELRPGDYNCLCVTDSGPGMSSETLQRAFEPFFTTRGSSGAGLGLSIVHTIVSGHGGAVVAHSTLGSGTTVLVYLPIQLEVGLASGASA